MRQHPCAADWHTHMQHASNDAILNHKTTFICFDFLNVAIRLIKISSVYHHLVLGEWHLWILNTCISQLLTTSRHGICGAGNFPCYSSIAWFYWTAKRKKMHSIPVCMLDTIFCRVNVPGTWTRAWLRGVSTKFGKSGIYQMLQKLWLLVKEIRR